MGAIWVLPPGPGRSRPGGGEGQTKTRNQTVARPRFQKPNPTLNPGTYQLANRGPLYLVWSGPGPGRGQAAGLRNPPKRGRPGDGASSMADRTPMSSWSQSRTRPKDSRKEQSKPHFALPLYRTRYQLT